MQPYNALKFHHHPSMIGVSRIPKQSRHYASVSQSYQCTEMMWTNDVLYIIPTVRRIRKSTFIRNSVKSNIIACTTRYIFFKARVVITYD